MYAATFRADATGRVDIVEQAPLEPASYLTPPVAPVRLAAARVHVKPPASSPEHRRTLRELVRAGCENRPGVYRMIAANGAVIYVGKSRVLRTRLLSYFRVRGRRDKGARILRHAFAIEWEYTPTEFGALLRELRLIKQYRPHFNSQLVTDEWPRAFVALTGGSVPALRVVPGSDDPAAVLLYGPFRSVGRLRDAVRVLAELAGMRDCTLDERVSFGRVRALGVSARVPGCLRRDLGSCPGPCVGEGSADAYAQSVTAARAFLDGTSDALLAAATRTMHVASDALQFERAASLRDRIERLAWLHARLQRFHANADRLTFRYHAIGFNGERRVYLVRRGTVRADLPAPTTPRERATLDALAKQIFTGPDPSGADIPTHDMDEFYLVSSWFRRRPGEKARTRRP